MSNHIIHKQKVNLQTTMSADAFALQNRISSLLKTDVPDVLASLFDQLFPKEKILRIDKLEINLGTLNEENLEAEFSQKLIEQLSNAISQKTGYSDLKNDGFREKFTGNNPQQSISPQTIPETMFAEVNQQQSMVDALIYFLEYGYLPWYYNIKKISEWETAMLQSFSTKEWGLLVTALKKNNNTTNYLIQRLALQFSGLFLGKIISHLHPSLNKNWEKPFIKKIIIPSFFWQQAITVGLSVADKNEFMMLLSKNPGEVIKETRNNNNYKRTIQKNNPEIQTAEKIRDINNSDINTRKDNQTAEEFFTKNSGVILLHPFLQMYFKELGLLNEQGFKNNEMQQRAVLLLHYLATGETEVGEFNLLLAKLLCAVGFNEPIANCIELTEREIEESTNLLKAVTQHWEPLKRTSAEGLRASFFQREGKLKETATGWLLQVEQKTIDILLNRLPWGIGIIKLPWMKNTLNVEWC